MGFLKNKELRNQLIVLLVCMGIYKIGIHIKVPGIDREILQEVMGQGGVFNMVDTFTGGALQNFSIFAVGIMPYITASIIIQLLQMDGIRVLTEWAQQGEYGQKKLKRVTYVLTLVFSMLQATTLTIGFKQMYGGIIKNPSVMSYVTIAFILTLGTVVLVILGEVIDRKGIGRGISMIILGGILMSVPTTIMQLVEMKYVGGNEQFISILTIGLVVIFFVVIMLAVIYIDGAARRIPIQSGRGGQYGGVSRHNSFLPVKLNIAGVIPVIFASAIFMLPNTLTNFVDNVRITGFIESYLSYSSYTGILIYALLIISFTYFYAFIQMDPEKVADNLMQSGTYVPTIRPGKNTVTYLTRVITRVTLVGSIFLAAVSVVPLMLGNVIGLPEGIIFGGTSIIIIVSVGVDFVTQLKTKTQGSRYSSFIKNRG